MKTQLMLSEMGKAFIVGAMSNITHPLTQTIATLADKGHAHRKVKEWDAHLTKRTYDKLKAEGVMP